MSSFSCTSLEMTGLISCCDMNDVLSHRPTIPTPPISPFLPEEQAAANIIIRLSSLPRSRTVSMLKHMHPAAAPSNAVALNNVLPLLVRIRDDDGPTNKVANIVVKQKRAEARETKKNKLEFRVPGMDCTHGDRDVKWIHHHAAAKMSML